MTPSYRGREQNKDDDLGKAVTGEKWCRQIRALAFRPLGRGCGAGRVGESGTDAQVRGWDAAPRTKGWIFSFFTLSRGVTRARIRPLPGQGRPRGSAARAGEGAAGGGLGCRTCISGSQKLRVTRSARSQDRVRSCRKLHRQFQDLTNLEREGRLGTAEAAPGFSHTHWEKHPGGRDWRAYPPLRTTNWASYCFFATGLPWLWLYPSGTFLAKVTITFVIRQINSNWPVRLTTNTANGPG